MAIDKNTLRQCIIDKQDEIDSAEIIRRDFDFEENGNYVFVGVRHTGKSYLMYQRVRELLSGGHGWDEILYLNFEDERLAELRAEDLNAILEVHYEHSGKKPFVFLDEVQNVEHWDKFVRRLADAKYRVYVTGSNARMLSKDVETTLGGRFFVIDVYPYSFKEFLTAKSVELSDGWEHSTVRKGEVVRAFQEYFYFGGLPEVNNFKAKRNLISSLYQKIYLGDICQRHRIGNDRVLNIMIKKLAESVRHPLSFNRLRNSVVATGAQISVPTTIDYVGFAEDSWLLLPMSNEVAKFSDKESIKKYYFIDNGILNLFLVRQEPALLENLVAIQLCRVYGKENVTYLNKEKEIDFIVHEERLAIQVSYSLKEKGTFDRETEPLVSFVQKNPEWTPLIITYDEEETIEQNGVTIPAVPVWKWLLQSVSCGLNDTSLHCTAIPSQG